MAVQFSFSSGLAKTNTAWPLLSQSRVLARLANLILVQSFGQYSLMCGSRASLAIDWASDSSMPTNTVKPRLDKNSSVLSVATERPFCTGCGLLKSVGNLAII